MASRSLTAAAEAGDGVKGMGHRDGDGESRRAPGALQRVSVAIADGHPMFRDALKRALRSWPEFDVMAVVGDASILELLVSSAPRVLLVDPASIEVADGELLAAADGRSRLVVIRMDPRPDEVYKLLTAGVVGFLGKDCSARDVCEAVAAAARGEARLGSSIQPLLARELRLRRGGTREFLTDRELEILKLMATGLNAPDIAAELKIGTATVKTHQSNVYERLGVHDAKEALVQAMRIGLIE